MKQSGFTLLELMVALAIAALTIGLVVPNLPKALAGADLGRAERLIAGGLRQARISAVSESREQVFQPANLPLPEGLVVDTVPARGVRFHADGSSSGGRIRVADGLGQRIIQVDWLTGRVQLAD